jgi:hypothetical protein
MLAAHRASLAVQRAMRILALSLAGRRAGPAALRDHRLPLRLTFMDGNINIDD